MNVRDKVNRTGGSLCFGWAIWEWPRVFIEAEHHAVYSAYDGSLHDITPPPDQDPEQTARLFLADPMATYDFDSANTTIRVNIRQALSHDPQIDEYLLLAEESDTIIRKIPGLGEVEVSGEDKNRLIFIFKRRSSLEREIAQRYTPQGAPCYCGSNKKFKRCHGQPLRRKS